jgi:hypothetical protein
MALDKQVLVHIVADMALVHKVVDILVLQDKVVDILVLQHKVVDILVLVHKEVDIFVLVHKEVDTFVLAHMVEGILQIVDHMVHYRQVCKAVDIQAYIVMAGIVLRKLTDQHRNSHQNSG